MQPEAAGSPYCGVAPQPAELLWRWNFDPWLLAGFGLTALIYLTMARRAPHAIQRPLAVPAAFLLLLVLFVSPICALSSALFAARASHHLMLTIVVAPLLVAAWQPPRAQVTHLIYLAPLIHALIFWAWHSPALYDLALAHAGAYWLMQATLTASAVLLWSSIRAAPRMLAIAALLLSMMQMGLLGALLTVAPTPLYGPHLLTTQAWGLTPLADQQLAGAVMWVLGGGVYLAAALAAMRRLLGGSGQAPAC